MISLVVLGGTSFIGKAIISAGNCTMPIKAVARRLPKDSDSGQAGVTWHTVDLSNPASLDSILEAGDIVINLIYMHDRSKTDNSLLLKNIIDACKRHGVARLIHCSTAIVAGTARESKVNELTLCFPSSPYEKTKYELELQLLQETSKILDFGILRPTAVVGIGGQNLVKLAMDLRKSSWIVNYLRASLYGLRPMHLVAIHNVVSALLHLASLPESLKGNIYIVASDDDPDNNFKRIEECLMRAMGLKKRRFPLIPIPLLILSVFLKILGRSGFDMAQKYDSSKLTSTGYVLVDSISSAVRAFGENMRVI